MTIDTDFLRDLDRFNLVVKKRVTSNYRGSRRSLARGHGIVFKDHRIYAQGDDIRAIDWKIFARTDNLFIKQFEEELSLNVHIILDASKSMDFGKALTKFDYGAMLAVGFAYLTIKENEKFQFSTFADKIEVFKSTKGLHQLASVVTYLNKLKAEGSSNFIKSMMMYKKLVQGKSLVLLISDFLFNIEDIKEGFYNFGRHDMKVIQVLDRVEKDLKLTGDMRLKDAESNDILRTFISPNLRVKYQNALDSHAKDMQKTCNSLGASFYQVTTDTPIFDAFYNILK